MRYFRVRICLLSLSLVCEVVFDCFGFLIVTLTCKRGILETTSSVSIGMAEKRKFCNLEAYDNYVIKEV